MTDLDLENRYREYLTCLNERRFHDLSEFVHNPVVHNDRTLSITEFQDLLRRDAAEIPDLHYAIERLVVQGEQVACRIRFDCTPAASFRGIPPTGRPISFVEHVFYRYQDGRIAEIWSLIDMEAIREQLTPSDPDR
ncbi:ester cyclase [Streptomyces luomodiensis]|uniref:Ester cyclase n=1 Tax=Streptomyces luomodiensis TaxID=3026192 RepID=A0ABY9VB77_9ACTN|nr:ester cyclase [Streptomyces sp. SCA4-21]WNF01160.1 ester cyclase [Streptomyces sp. SCA4-21]